MAQRRQNSAILRDSGGISLNYQQRQPSITNGSLSNPSNISQKSPIGDPSGVVAFFKEKSLSAWGLFWDKVDYFVGHSVSYIIQGIFYPIFFISYNSFFKLKINGKENLKDVQGPIIFVANHIGFYDSFIFDLFIPMFSPRISPFRFMGTTQFQIWYLKIVKYTGLIHLVYLLFGVFKVTYGQGAEKALRPAYNIVQHGGTVAIFPEGKIKRNSKTEVAADGTPITKEPIGPFKWGAAILAKNTGAVLIPVAFNKENKKTWRDRLTVNIGTPYFVNKFESDEALADEMRGKVLELYNK